MPEPQKEQPETRPPRAPAKNGQMALAAASNMPFQSISSFICFLSYFSRVEMERWRDFSRVEHVERGEFLAIENIKNIKSF